MPKNKAPGSDGFIAYFYQAIWLFMGNDIWELVKESKWFRQVYPTLNSTFISLIPKQENSENPEGFHPISLFNVLYKILSMIMVKILKSILPNLISPEQTGFVKGRQILDGIIMTQEAIHSLRSLKAKCILIKLDLSKAYDCLSWPYLKVVLSTFGFDGRWIQWLMSFISSPNFSILLNGIPSNPFNVSRGLRQGDPLSPFLFIIAVEGLGRLIKSKLQEGQLKGLNLWGPDLTLSHQQFVDDILLFFQAMLREAKAILSVLKDFMATSGTLINNDKSNVYFFKSNEVSQRFLA